MIYIFKVWKFPFLMISSNWFSKIEVAIIQKIGVTHPKINNSISRTLNNKFSQDLDKKSNKKMSPRIISLKTKSGKIQLLRWFLDYHIM